MKVGVEYELFISEIVVGEAAIGDAELARQRLAIAADLSLLAVTEEAERLAPPVCSLSAGSLGGCRIRTEMGTKRTSKRMLRRRAAATSRRDVSRRFGRKEVVGFGVVKIMGGPHAGRIGVYDDDDMTSRRAIVYFGDMEYVKGYYFVPRGELREVTTDDLLTRRKAISRQIGVAARLEVDDSERADLLAELLVIDNALDDRMIVARATEPRLPKRVFISHSSKDKQFARWMAVDLKFWPFRLVRRVGYPRRRSEGIVECEALIVVLSEHAVRSQWVEREWQAKYWDELKDGKVRVLPALLQPCEVPTLLKTKKYANFAEAYSDGIEQLLAALR